jgi:DNA modification methylase
MKIQLNEIPIKEVSKGYIQFNKELKSNSVTLLKNTNYEKYYQKGIEGKLEYIKKKEWRYGVFGKQHWGIKMHGLSPYIGRMTPAMAYWLVVNSSKRGDNVLDPFGGVGTVALESSLLGRNPISIDISPYANLIATAKFDHMSLEDEIKYLKTLSKNNICGIGQVPPEVGSFFNSKTLDEILYYGNCFVKDNNKFELACLMGILHGNRPGYLSGYTGCIIPMKLRTSLHPKYNPSRDIPEYRSVLPRLVGKLTIMFSDSLVNKPLKGKCLHQNSKDLSRLHSGSVDVIISSPPYYDTLNYVDSNWLRLDILKACGFTSGDINDVEANMTQHKNSYLDDMCKIGIELKRVLKTKGKIIFVLGDVHTSKGTINTAENISNNYAKIGFNTIEIVNDEIPRNKCAVQNKKHEMKFDRLLIMESE